MNQEQTQAQPGDKKWSKWLSRVETRRDAFKKGWWKAAEKALKMYSPDGEDQSQDNPFNILYANTEVLLPSLYSASPRPDVATRHDAPVAPAKAAEQFLRTAIDDNSPGMESFDCALEGAVLSGLVPGAGGVRLRAYKGEPHPIRWEEYKYNQMVWGYAKKWSRVPWIAFLHPISREDLLSQFPDMDKAKLKAVESQEELDEKEEDAKQDGCNHVLVELWIKADRTTVWLCAEYEDILLEKITDDPLKLAGFYPTPGPLTLVRKPQDLTPTPLYEYYRQQATELNRVTVRLNKVLEAIKVRGGYASGIANELSTILDNSDMENKMVPMSTIGPETSIDKLIWLLPIDKLITVAKELYSARQAIVQTIQQITGLADIVRGASVASETATAQELKNKWGTIRLRRMQTSVARYVRDLLRIAVDAATTICSPQEWRKITGLPYPMAAEKQAAQQQVEQQMLAYQQQTMLAQQAGQQPPPPPEPDPALQKVLSQPTWEEVLQLLQEDAGRCYLIDIETSSTIDADASADKQEASEFMGAFAQLVQGMAPLAELGPPGIELAKAIIASVCKRFKLGREVDEAIKALEPPPPKEDEGEKVKLEIEKMKLEGAKMEHEFKKEELAMKKQEIAFKTQAAQTKHQLDMEKLTRQHQLDMQSLQATTTANMLQAQTGMQATQQKGQLANESFQQKSQLGAQQHKQKLQAAQQRPNPKKPS